MYVQSAYWCFSSSISRVICCVGICCSAGSKPGTSRKMVAPRSSWFVSTTEEVYLDLWIQNIFKSSPEVPTQKAEAPFFQHFWLEQPAFLWSGWPGSLQIFSLCARTLFPEVPGLLSSPPPWWALSSWHQQWLLERHFGLCQACSCWHLKLWPRRLWHTP